MKALKSEQKLFTRKELCEIWGLSEDQFDRRKEKYGWKPTSKAILDKSDKPVFLYDKDECEEIERANRAEEETKSRFALTHRKANALSEEIKGAVMSQEIERLDNDDSEASLDACITNAVGFMAMLNRKIERLRDKNHSLQNENTKLLGELDERKDQMTVETYAIMVLGKKINRQSASRITRHLHTHGYKDLGRIPSKYDNNMPATVWNVELLDLVAADTNLFDM